MHNVIFMFRKAESQPFRKLIPYPIREHIKTRYNSRRTSCWRKPWGYRPMRTVVRGAVVYAVTGELCDDPFAVFEPLADEDGRLIDVEEIEAIAEEHNAAPEKRLAQKTLAREILNDLHGEGAYESAEVLSR